MTQLTPVELQATYLALKQLKAVYEGVPLQPMMFYDTAPSAALISWDGILAMATTVGEEQYGRALYNAQITLLDQLLDRVGTAYVTSPLAKGV